MLHLPWIKKVPASKKKELHRGSCIEKNPYMAKGITPPPAFTSLHFHLMTPYIVTLVSIQLQRVNEFQNVFLSRALIKVQTCDLFPFQSINSKYRWFVTPFYAQDHWDSLSWGVIEGVEWHQNNWFDEPSSPGRHSTKQTGQATNSAPFIFNYTLLTALEDNVTHGKNGGKDSR